MGDLRIKDLVVEYSSDGYAVRPIDGLDLEVTAGSLAILLGPSGCGKTTLLSCLGGILMPTAGRIDFGDVAVTTLNRRRLGAYRRDTVGIPGVQPGGKSHGGRKRDGAAAGGRTVGVARRTSAPRSY
jgi:putative ABC transport system ATP-binding protein